MTHPDAHASEGSTATLTSVNPWVLTFAPAERRIEAAVNQWFGSGPGWGDGAPVLPVGWWLGDVSGVTSSPEGEIFAFQRGQAADPILVFDRSGRFLRSWGRGELPVPHSIRRGPDGDLWVTDTDLHQVIRYRPDGTRVLALGRPHQAGNDDTSFNMPTDTAFGADGRLYVSDGYGNGRVVVFDADARYLGEWGRPGTGDGEFDTVHSVAVGPDGRVFVADRGNARIQVFDPDGRPLTIWNHLGYTQGITVAPNGELWAVSQTHSAAGRVFRLDPESGEILAWLDSPGHMLEVAAWGDLYCASLMGNVIEWKRSA
jgi:DNA-binding beta-propeller fold protein YncE